MSMSTSRVSALSAVGLLLPLMGYAAPAAADELACGDVVMSSTVLTADLVCGPGDGLVIGADGVVLDLDGHSITGPGAYGAGAGAGVRIGQRTGVTVTNGEIAGYGAAVDVQQSWDVVVSKLHAHDGDRGINVGTGGRHLIEKNLITDNGRDAVRLAGTVDTTVAKNVLERNVFGIGVANNSVRTTVAKNVVSSSGGFGIAFWDFTVDSVVDKNVVTGSSGDGIEVGDQTSGTLLTKNEAYGNGQHGIEVLTTQATLAKNLAVGNGWLGISALSGVTDGGGNMAAGNGDARQCTGVVCVAPS